MKYDYTYEDAFGNEVEVFGCSCGRSHHVYAGGDIACCYCEFENEGQEEVEKEKFNELMNHLQKAHDLCSVLGIGERLDILTKPFDYMTFYHAIKELCSSLSGEMHNRNIKYHGYNRTSIIG
jgi:hypothetical protein